MLLQGLFKPFPARPVEARRGSVTPPDPAHGGEVVS